MIKLDISVLEEVGLGDIPESEKVSLFQTFVERLELNVGTSLSSNLSEEQTDAFMQIVNSGNQEQARDWLENNAPDYKQVVAQELEKLKAEFKKEAESIRQHLEQEGQ